MTKNFIRKDVEKKLLKEKKVKINNLNDTL